MHSTLLLGRSAALFFIVFTLPAFLCPQKQVLLPYEENGKWGFMKPDRTTVVTPQYKDVRGYSEKMAAIKVEGHKWGFIGEEGWVKVEPVHWLVGDFHDGRAWTLTIKEKWRYINLQGKFIEHPELEYASNFSEKLANVIRNGKYGYINTSGKVVIPFEYDIAYPFSEGQGLALKDAQWRALDPNGKVLYKPKCDEVFPLSDGLARCRSGNLWGYTDTAGQWKIKPQFEQALDFKEGLAPAAKKGEPWIMINGSGREEFRFPPTVRWVYPFTCKDYTTFHTDAGFGIIDRSGKVRKEPKWEFAQCLGGGIFNVRHQKRWGYYHTDAGFLWQGPTTDR